MNPRQAGFTMVELIVTMIMIGILAAVAIPRMNVLGGFDEIGYRDQVIAMLEFTRKAAVAQRRYACVQRSGDTLAASIDTDMPEGRTAAACPRQQDLNLPGSNSSTVSPRGSTVLGGMTAVVFDPLGRATVTGGNLVVNGAYTLTIDSGTGYVSQN